MTNTIITKLTSKKINKSLIALLFTIGILIVPLSGVHAAPGITLTPSGGATILREGGNLKPSYGYTFQIGGTGSDVAQFVQADSNGNLYIAGSVSGSTDLSVTDDIDPTRGAENVTPSFVGGARYTPNIAAAAGDQMFFSKINRDGTLNYTYDIGNDEAEYLSHMIIDGSGNIYAVGFFTGTVDFDPTAGVDNKTSVGSSEYFLLKINANGSYGYTKTMGSANIVLKGLAKDSSNNIYVTGGFSGAGTNLNFTGSGASDPKTSDGATDPFVVKINSNSSYGGSYTLGGTGLGYGYRLSIDSSNNIYVAGNFSGVIDLDPTAGTDNKTGTGTDMFLVKINSDGSYGFGKQITGSDSEVTEDIKTDGLGNVYLSGDYSGTVDIDNDGTPEATATAFEGTYITKLDSTGAFLFKYTLEGVGVAGTMQIRSIAIDGNNDVYYSGMAESTAAVDFNVTGAGAPDSINLVALNGYKAFFTKLHSDGSYDYTYLPVSNSHNEYSSIALSGDGRIYTCGYFDGSGNMDPTGGTDIKTSTGSYDGFATMFVPDDLYLVRLADVPANNVTVGMTPNNDLYTNLFDASNSAHNTGLLNITFTPTNWDVDRFVFVKAIDDTLDESAGQSGFIDHTSTSTDPTFNGLTAKLTATISDNGNDVTPITTTVTESAGSTWVSESGATDTYTVVLGDQPVSNVTVTPSFDAAKVNVTPANIVFTPYNWNTPQTFTVSAVDDGIVEGNHNSVITHTATSADPIFNGIVVASVTANIVDNDGAVVNLSKQTVNVTEGGATDSFNVNLGFAPTNDVTVDLSTGGKVSVNPTSLTFTPANFATPQTVTVTAVEDPLIEGPHGDSISFSLTSLDLGYNSLGVIPVSANITDNDIADVTITQSSGNTSVTEGGNTDSYTLVLTSQPTANVDIDLTTTPASQITTNPTTVTFTSGNWNVPQTVTVTAIDNYSGSNHTATVSHAVSSADTNFNGIVVADISVTVLHHVSGGGGGGISPSPAPLNSNPQPTIQNGGVSQQINSGNGSIVNLPDGSVGANVVPGTFSSDVSLKLLDNTNPPQTPNGYVLVDAFDINAYILSSGQKVGALNKNISLTINYSGKSEVLELIEPGTLGLYYWDLTSGAWITVNGSNDLTNKKILANINQLGTYSIFGKLKAGATPPISPSNPYVPGENIIKEYVVQPGDSLKGIAQNLFGDENKWTLLVDMNKDQYPTLEIDPNNIYSGWVLKYSSSGQASLAPSLPLLGINTPVIEGGYGLYTVQPGDDLQWIAQKLYSDSNKWTRLVELNQDQYPSLYDGGANAVYTGWVLKYDLGQGYDYDLVYQSPYPSELKPGETTNVWIEVKNTGSSIWKGNVRLGSGSQYGDSAQQQDYTSEFANSDWLSPNRPIGMSDGTRSINRVEPGWHARFQFNIKAPSTPGTYKAYFTPVADGTAWMKDIGIYWEIKVR